MSIETQHLVKGKLESPKLAIVVACPSDRVPDVERAVQAALDTISSAVIDQQKLPIEAPPTSGHLFAGTGDGVVLTPSDTAAMPFNGDTEIDPTEEEKAEELAGV